MKSIQLVICFVFLAIVTNAQSGKNKKGAGILFFHSHGISFQKFANLNNRVAAYPQFEKSKNSTGTLQFGIFAERRRFITVYGVNIGSSLSGNRDKKSTTIGFKGLSFDAGYDLLKSKRISLYPYAGIGYEKYKMVLNKDISGVPFDSVLQSNNFQQRTESLAFTNSFLSYRLGIGMSITSKKNARNSFGLLVDYSGGLSGRDWKINNSQTLMDSPADKLSKLSISLLFRYNLKEGSNR